MGAERSTQTTASRYVIVTPAKNEEQFIGLTLVSVTAQTILPERWVIVSDGSTDRTDEIVRQYAAEHPWIELVSVPSGQTRSFGGKVAAFLQGYARLKDVPYDVLVSLDADISFGSDYFEFLLAQLRQDAALGLVGTPFQEAGKPMYDYRVMNIEHVSGACQVFRRECFEEIGGYTPVKGGGIDLLAVLKSRKYGWKTRTFTDRVCSHHRTMGTADQSVVAARFKYGLKDYAFGNHPLCEVVRAMYQCTRPPVGIGGLAVLAGYVYGWLSRSPRPIPPDVAAFNRAEQMTRLRAQVRRAFGLRSSSGAIA